MGIDGVLERLRSDVSGRTIVPGDDDYEAARIVFAGSVDARPAAIVRVANDKDVAYVVRLARDSGLPLAVRSGGHSPAGHGVVDDGIVLDLRDMRALDIDVDGRTAWAETGLTAADYSAALGAHGLVTGFGDTASVGLGGITLGGGVGFLARKYGLTIDDLLAADVVTADGETLRVDAANHPDLFWAIRGGGGNFGVATRFQFRAHPLEEIVGGMLFLPATPEVIAGFIAAAEAAPDELSTIANVMNCPPMPFVAEEFHGQVIVMALMAYAGDAAAAEPVLAPFRALATPLADLLNPMPYHEIFLEEDPEDRPTAAAAAMFMDSVDVASARAFLETLEESDAELRVVQLRVLGGAIGRVPPDATAFAHRRSRIMVYVVAFYNGPEDRVVREAWVAELAASLQQGDQGTYVNFLGDEGADRVRAAYPGATYERLAEIKARYDPTNLFRLNQNIPPRPAASGS